MLYIRTRPKIQFPSIPVNYYADILFHEIINKRDSIYRCWWSVNITELERYKRIEDLQHLIDIYEFLNG